MQVEGSSGGGKDGIGSGPDSRGVARAGDRGEWEEQRQRRRRSGVEKALEVEERREQEIDEAGSSSSGGQEDRGRNSGVREREAMWEWG